MAASGIHNQEDLFSHQALMRGRQLVGGAVVSAGAMMYLDGRMTGPGPTDPATRRLWRKLGYPFNSIKVWTPLGDKWVGYESLEPYNTILSTIATIGDNQKLMGDDWTEQNLFSHSLSVGLAASSHVATRYLPQLSAVQVPAVPVLSAAQAATTAASAFALEIAVVAVEPAAALPS